MKFYQLILFIALFITGCTQVQQPDTTPSVTPQAAAAPSADATVPKDVTTETEPTIEIYTDTAQVVYIGFKLGPGNVKSVELDAKRGLIKVRKRVSDDRILGAERPYLDEFYNPIDQEAFYVRSITFLDWDLRPEVTEEVPVIQDTK
jgi:hypothetical protein